MALDWWDSRGATNASNPAEHGDQSTSGTAHVRSPRLVEKAGSRTIVGRRFSSRSPSPCRARPCIPLRQQPFRFAATFPLCVCSNRDSKFSPSPSHSSPRAGNPNSGARYRATGHISFSLFLFNAHGCVKPYIPRMCCRVGRARG